MCTLKLYNLFINTKLRILNILMEIKNNNYVLQFVK